MEELTVANWIVDLMVILAAGFLSGLLCKRLGVSLLVGYLIVGAVIGGGGLRLVTQEHGEIEWVARTGALLLLFSIGMEFSLGELRRLSRYFFVGGSIQMLLCSLPLIVALPLLGWNWKAALMIGAATSLSSTVLVFKALTEYGELEKPHGRRAIAILLFQDVALVPLMLVMPMLTGEGMRRSRLHRAVGGEHGIVPDRRVCDAAFDHLFRSADVGWIAECGIAGLVFADGAGNRYWRRPSRWIAPCDRRIGGRIGAGRQPLERSSGCHDLAVS